MPSSSDVWNELAYHKPVSQLYAHLEHSDSGSGILGSRKDEEEPLNIKTMNSVELGGGSATNAVFFLTLPS